MKYQDGIYHKIDLDTYCVLCMAVILTVNGLLIYSYMFPIIPVHTSPDYQPVPLTTNTTYMVWNNDSFYMVWYNDTFYVNDSFGQYHVINTTQNMTHIYVGGWGGVGPSNFPDAMSSELMLCNHTRIVRS